MLKIVKESQFRYLDICMHSLDDLLFYLTNLFISFFVYSKILFGYTLYSTDVFTIKINGGKWDLFDNLNRRNIDHNHYKLLELFHVDLD